MVYGFVKQSGGAIGITSQVDRGTTVSLWLPSADIVSDLQPPTNPAHAEAPAGQGLALLVEDESEVRKVVRRWLLELGFAVIEADLAPSARRHHDR